MSSTIEALTKTFTPSTIEKISNTFKIDAKLLPKGLELTGPLLVNRLAQVATTPNGLEQIIGNLPNPDTGWWPKLMDNINHMLGRDTQDHNELESILGLGKNAIGKTMHSSLGFDIVPVLGTIAPVMLGVVGEQFHGQKLRPEALAQWLQTELVSSSDQLKPEAKILVRSALAAHEVAASIPNQFAKEDWQHIQDAPLAAIYYVAASAKSSLKKKLSAAQETLQKTVNAAPATSLLTIAFEKPIQSSEKDNNINDSTPHEQLLAKIRSANTAIRTTHPGDAHHFDALIQAVALRTAEATKEGGFLGIGGRLVTEAEAAAISEITKTLA